MITLYKPIGKSCLDCVKEFRYANTAYKDIKMGFSGRLDEMAHGQLHVLIGDETKNMAKYNMLDKIYKFKFIIGVETDSTDILGIIKNKEKCCEQNIYNLLQYLQNTNNTQFEQEFHIYSSITAKHKTIKKPLWWWAVNNRLNEISEIQSKKVNIYKIYINCIKNITVDEFKINCLHNLSKLKEGAPKTTVFAPGGECKHSSRSFRKEYIMDQWKKYDDKNEFTEIECCIHVSSGFYIRQFVKDIGKHFNLNVLVTDIERVKYA